MKILKLKVNIPVSKQMKSPPKNKIRKQLTK